MPHSRITGEFTLLDRDENAEFSPLENKAFSLENGFSVAVAGEMPTSERSKCNNNRVCETLLGDNPGEIQDNRKAINDKFRRKKQRRGRAKSDKSSDRTEETTTAGQFKKKGKLRIVFKFF